MNRFSALALAAALLLPTVGRAEICQRYGNVEYCDNGRSSQTYGNSTFYNDGVNRQDYGDTSVYSNGITSQSYGNTRYCN